MSILDIFKPQQQQQQQQEQQQQGGNPSNGQQGKGDLSANPPATGPDGKIPGTTPTDQNPLDIYQQVFDNAAKNSEIEAPKFHIDPKVLSEVSGKMSFTKGLDQELLQKATSGDVGSLLEIINKVGQNSYRAAIEHNTTLTDQFLNKRGEFEAKRLNKGVREQLTSSALADTPNYQHPVIKAELNRVASQFAAANPDASPQEVAQAAKKYIDDIQAALNPKSQETDPNQPNGEMDWSKYLTS